MRRWWLVPVAIATVAHAAVGQTDRLRRGAHVRLHAPAVADTIFTGWVQSRHADTIVVRTSGPRTPEYVVLLSTVRSVEVARKERMRPALIGGAIGAALGYPAYRYFFNCIDILNDPNGGCHKIRGSGVAASIAGLAVLGAGTGALVGMERWERIPLQPVVVWTGGRPQSVIGGHFRF
jgi:hypothetical protein